MKNDDVTEEVRRSGAEFAVDVPAGTTKIGNLALSVFRLSGSDAGSAIRLHVGDSAAGSDQGFRKLGGRDRGAALAAAGIVDGAVLGVKPRKRGWCRGRVELEVVASAGSGKLTQHHRQVPLLDVACVA